MTISSAMHREMFNLLCSREIGSGMSRVTWSSNLLPDCVVKIEEDSGRFQNVVEWETWQRVKDTQYSKWFAECKWISPNGSVLIMERTRIAAESDYPEKMPVFLTDFKRSNYGLSGEFLVCHDYGTHMMFENGMTKRLQKVSWVDR